MSALSAFIQYLIPSNSVNATNDSRRHILTRLKFIGSLQAHQKIDSHTLKIEATNFFTPIKRMFITGDSRDSTLQFFNNTIDRSCEIVNGSIHSDKITDKIFCANIIQDLMASVKGLKATQKTYEGDPMFQAEVQVLLQTIEAFILGIQRSHPDIFTIKEMCILKIKNEEVEVEKSTSKSIHKGISLADSDNEEMP